MVCQLDSVLTHLGTGRWSLLHFIAMAYSSIFLSPLTFGGAFLAPLLDFSCRVPSSSTPAATTTTTSVLLEAHSSHSSTFPSFTSDGQCQYTIITAEGQVTEDCVEFDFDNSTFSSTFTSEYNLACGRAYLQTSFQSIYMLGVFTGAPVNGFLSDKYGRKRLVVIGSVVYLLLGLVSAWLPLLSTILIARFVMGYFHAAVSYTSYVHIVEVLEPKMRIVAGYGIYNLWVVGMIIYSGFGYLIRDWRLLQTLVILPGLLILPLFWVIDESPRWLIVNGRPEEALRILKKVARWHGVDLPPEADLKQLVEEQNPKAQATPKESSMLLRLRSVTSEFLVLLRTPRLRTITLCFYINYLMSGIVYFGLSLSGAIISDDPFMYLVLSGLMEVPAYTLLIPLAKHFGRKRPQIFFMLISGIVLLALGFIPTEYNTTVITLAMLGKVAITGAFQTVNFYSSELFPTEVRNRGISTSYMMSRVGATLSPFITDLVGTTHPWAPFVVFGSGALLAGVVTFLLPETRGQVLPDTVTQLEERGSKGTRNKSPLI